MVTTHELQDETDTKLDNLNEKLVTKGADSDEVTFAKLIGLLDRRLSRVEDKRPEPSLGSWLGKTAEETEKDIKDSGKRLSHLLRSVIGLLEEIIKRVEEQEHPPDHHTHTPK